MRDLKKAQDLVTQSFRVRVTSVILCASLISRVYFTQSDFHLSDAPPMHYDPTQRKKVGLFTWAPDAFHEKLPHEFLDILPASDSSLLNTFGLENICITTVDRRNVSTSTKVTLPSENVSNTPYPQGDSVDLDPRVPQAPPPTDRPGRNHGTPPCKAWNSVSDWAQRNGRDTDTGFDVERGSDVGRADALACVSAGSRTSPSSPSSPTNSCGSGCVEGLSDSDVLMPSPNVATSRASTYTSDESYFGTDTSSIIHTNISSSSSAMVIPPVYYSSPRAVVHSSPQLSLSTLSPCSSAASPADYDSRSVASSPLPTKRPSAQTHSTPTKRAKVIARDDVLPSTSLFPAVRVGGKWAPSLATASEKSMGAVVSAAGSSCKGSSSSRRRAPVRRKAYADPSDPRDVYPCHIEGCGQVCASSGDLGRHMESLAHKTPSYTCFGCGKQYTRTDALKRHHTNTPKCKQQHRDRQSAM
jgi:hypothetical protein